MKIRHLLTAAAILALTFTGGQLANALTLHGIAYVQGHGGHLAVINLANGNIARFEHGKPSDAITLSKNGKIAYCFSLDGYAREIHVDTGKMTPWVKLGKEHCGSAIAPSGNIWVSDMKDGHVYVYSPTKHKLVDSFPVSKSICGIAFSKDGKTAYISDMPGGFINIVDVKTKKVVGKIAGAGEFIHRSRITPNGKYLWQSDGAELANGKPIGVGYADAGATPGGVSIINLKTGKVVDYVIIGGNPHGVDFTPNGKYALVSTRQYPSQDDSSLVVVNTRTKRIVKVYSACKACHGYQGVDVPKKDDGGHPFLCGVDVDWHRNKIPAGAQMLVKGNALLTMGRAEGSLK